MKLLRGLLSLHSISMQVRTFFAKTAAPLILGCFLVGSAMGQSTFGTILGTVQDSQGGLIPGAVLKAQSLDQSDVRTTTSGTSGEFVFENLKAGQYKVTAHKDGFTDSVVSSVTLEARQELRLPITLTITAGATTVEVQADAALLNTENGTINNSLSYEAITQLPINSGRCRAVLWQLWLYLPR